MPSLPWWATPSNCESKWAFLPLAAPCQTFGQNGYKQYRYTWLPLTPSPSPHHHPYRTLMSEPWWDNFSPNHIVMHWVYWCIFVLLKSKGPDVVTLAFYLEVSLSQQHLRFLCSRAMNTCQVHCLICLMILLQSQTFRLLTSTNGVLHDSSPLTSFVKWTTRVVMTSFSLPTCITGQQERVTELMNITSQTCRHSPPHPNPSWDSSRARDRICDVVNVKTWIWLPGHKLSNLHIILKDKIKLHG